MKAGRVVVAVAAALAATAGNGAAQSAQFVDRTLSCQTRPDGAFGLEYDPAVKGGWFAVDISVLLPLVEVGAGRGFRVNGSHCARTAARAPLTRKGIRGSWLVYRSEPRCAVPGKVVVHVRGTVSALDLFAGQVAVRMAPSGLKIAYATFDRAGTARAFVSRRCSAGY